MKRKLSIFLVTILIFFSIKIPSQATALPIPAIDPLTMEELAMALHSVIQTYLISSGVNDGLDSYETNKEIHEKFISYLKSNTSSLSSLDGLYFSCVDAATGERFAVVCNKGEYSVYDASGVKVAGGAERDLVNNLHLVEEDRYKNFHVVGGNNDPDNNQNEYTNLEKIALGTSLSAILANFVNQMKNDDELDLWKAKDKFNGYEYDESGNFFYKFNSYYENNGNSYSYECAGYSSQYQLAGLLNGTSLSIYGKTTSTSPDDVAALNSSRYFLVCDALFKYAAGTQSSYTARKYTTFNCNNPKCNFPIFTSKADIANFFLTEDLTGCINISSLQLKTLASISSLTAGATPMVNKYFSPLDLGNIANAVYTAAQQFVVNPQVSPAVNTQAYQQSFQNALTQTVAQAAPEPLPNVNPNPEVNPNPDPAPDYSDVNTQDYEVNLSGIFPFCIPFDLVHLIEALKADPVAPVFEWPVKIGPLNFDETVVLDLSWMDPIMVVFRYGILISFIIGLILITRKLIKW